MVDGNENVKPTDPSAFARELAEPSIADRMFGDPRLDREAARLEEAGVPESDLPIWLNLKIRWARALGWPHDVPPSTHALEVMTARLQRRASDAERRHAAASLVALDKLPHPYACSECGVSGVKLWRCYQTCLDAQDLKCRACTLGEQQSVHDPSLPESDAIGWRVPAVPDNTGTYWGYTSVPDRAVEWWRSLPEKHEGTTKP